MELGERQQSTVGDPGPLSVLANAGFIENVAVEACAKTAFFAHGWRGNASKFRDRPASSRIIELLTHNFDRMFSVTRPCIAAAHTEEALKVLNSCPMLAASAASSNRQPLGTWTMRWSVSAESLLSA